MLALAFKLISLLPGFTNLAADYIKTQADTQLKGFQAGSQADTDRYKAFVEAQVETNRMKLIANGWWGAKMIILISGGSASVHFGAIFWDSVPFPYFWLGDWYLPVINTHVIGSWKIPKVPAPYDGYQWALVQSFFVTAPLMPVASAAAQWLSRKR